MTAICLEFVCQRWKRGRKVGQLGVKIDLRACRSAVALRETKSNGSANFTLRAPIFYPKSYGRMTVKGDYSMTVLRSSIES